MDDGLGRDGSPARGVVEGGTKWCERRLVLLVTCTVSHVEEHCIV